MNDISVAYCGGTPGKNRGMRTNLARLLSHGLAGTCKLVILPIDQGLERGPGQPM